MAATVQHISEVEAALTRIRIINGCSVNDISFDHPNWGHVNYTHAPVISAECNIYSPSGGGVPFRYIDTSILHPAQNAESTFGEYAFSGGIWVYQVDDSMPDLTMMIPHLTEETCMEIQDKMSITGSFQTNGANWLGTLDAANITFDGDYANQYSFSSSRQHSCIQLAGSTDNYLFYYTLIDN